MSTLQTLDRGLRALDVVAQSAAGISVADLARELDVHRAILPDRRHARGARTGRTHRRRPNPAGRECRRPRVHGFEPQFAGDVQPILHLLANETRATAFVSAAQGENCVVIPGRRTGGDAPARRVPSRQQPSTRPRRRRDRDPGDAPGEADRLRRGLPASADGFSLTRDSSSTARSHRDGDPFAGRRRRHHRTRAQCRRRRGSTASTPSGPPARSSAPPARSSGSSPSDATRPTTPHPPPHPAAPPAAPAPRGCRLSRFAHLARRNRPLTRNKCAKREGDGATTGDKCAKREGGRNPVAGADSGSIDPK